MKLTSGTVPVYTVAGSETGRRLPNWLSQNKKRGNDSDNANKIELLQDFGFEEASQCVRVSEDGEWVMSTGTYKPQIHTHYLPNLSLSWARHTDTLNKTFLLLSTDYSKSVHLQEDRSLEFHSPGGCQHALRLPRYGRDLAYDQTTADLLVPTIGVNNSGFGEVYRVSLELGRFMTSFEVDVGGDNTTVVGSRTLQGGIQAGAVNTAAIAQESHNLYAFGTSIGTVEYWDPRSRSRIATLAIPHDFDERPGVTALSFHGAGVQHAIGCSSGLVYLYDLRSPSPILKKDQGYGYPIQHVEFLTPRSSRMAALEPKVLSADKRIIKIWEQGDGSPWTSIEPNVDMNCVAWCKDTGMVLTANEGKQQHAFFIPQLGPAPKWCTFLDNVVEELAEDPNDPHAFKRQTAGEVYDNYKFLTISDLRNLSLDHLVGKTNLLRPYMHGYFVAQGLYEEARLIANPSSWEAERAKRVQEKIDKERESRIRGPKKVAAKVNRKMVERILDREEKNERKRAQRVLALGGDPETTTAVSAKTQRQSDLLGDSRFARLFQDEDFTVDETSREFQQLNPNVNPLPISGFDQERGLTAVEQEAIQEVPGSSNDSGSDDERFGLRNSNKTERVSSADYKRGRRKDQRRHRDELEMRMSSTGKPSKSKPAEDRTFGSRIMSLNGRHKGGANRRAATIYGNRSITFDPKGKNIGSLLSKEASVVERSRMKDRRSASKNQFRGM